MKWDSINGIFYLLMLKKKKLEPILKGCLFEAFLGAFNKINIHDDEKWFDNVFVTGGFQIAQIFVETVFNNHIQLVGLLQTNDNYKNRLQVVLQKAFKVTPIYMEISEWDEKGYHMGVFLCIGQHYLV